MATPTSKRRILVVDDDASVRDSLSLILSRVYDVAAASSGEEALSKLSADPGQMPDLVLVDVMMPGIDGIALLRKIKTKIASLPVIMLTASNNIKSAVQAMKLGAVDYLNKPFDVDELLSLVKETIQQGPADRSAPSAVITSEFNRHDLPIVPGDFGSIVGKSPLMAELFQKVAQLAERDTTILITGESGTGKELIAREIHARSPRKDGPFVALNCSAIPETLIESELFGHERGAFTHAVEKRIGHFELADCGTLFLDEIGELSLPVQVKILRFLQEREFYRIGRSKPMRVDVRIVAATNRSLESAVKAGTFRQDLFYRINVVTLELPPLRDRPEDVAALAHHFAKRLAPLYGNRQLTFSDNAFQILQRYAWPGNVRELENVVESLLALSSKSEITETDLPGRLRHTGEGGSAKDLALSGQIPFEEAERAFETELILNALRRTNYVQTQAAELLGISRRILKYKMDKLGIPDDPEAGKGQEKLN